MQPPDAVALWPASASQVDTDSGNEVEQEGECPYCVLRTVEAGMSGMARASSASSSKSPNAPARADGRPQSTVACLDPHGQPAWLSQLR